MNVDEFLRRVEAGLDETDRTVTGPVTMEAKAFREHCLTHLGVARNDVQKYAGLNMPIDYDAARRLVRFLEEALRIGREYYDEPR